MTETEVHARIAEFRESSIKLAVAAPYFQPEVWEPEVFLEERGQKIAALEQEAHPMRIVPGAVVPLSFCLESPRLVRHFALGDSAYLLVDLPREPLTEEYREKLTRMRIVTGLYPIAVDIDRYYDIWSPEDWFVLRELGLMLQVSINGIIRQEYRKLSLYLIANQHVHFIATGSRQIGEPLRFGDAMRLIQRTLPAQLYRRVKNNAGMLLSNAGPSEFL